MRSGEGTADSWKCCERVEREEEGGVNAEMVAMMKAKNMSVQHLLLPPEERKRLAIVWFVGCKYAEQQLSFVVLV